MRKNFFGSKIKHFFRLGILLVILNLFLPTLSQAAEKAPLLFLASNQTQNLTLLPPSHAPKEPDKKIVISFSGESLTAYENGAIVLQTPVTTGGPGTPTPAGSYKVIAKLQNFTMNSPWPVGDWRWYASSFVHYGLEFRDDGYFIHDASWRSNFGPGSNSQRGTPGGNYTGTHGCVNVPLSAEATLYSWAQVGTTVIVQP